MTRSVSDRFFSKVNWDGPVVREELGPCAVWTASCNGDGYGQFRDGENMVHAHRWAYEHGSGEPIQPGINVLHHCDNPPCVLYGHLFSGTQADNIADMHLKGRERHPAGEENGRAKLSWVDVCHIRDRYVRGSRTDGTVAIATDYCVAQRLVWLIVNGRIWKAAA